MKIEQEKEEFKPITITLETYEEAIDFIRGVDIAFNKYTTVRPESGTKSIFNRISNEFTNKKLV